MISPTFQTTFVHPARIEHDERTHTSPESVLGAFLEIDWAGLSRIACGETDEDGGLNAFYFFEARYLDASGCPHIMNISGEYTHDTDAPRLTLHYHFPERRISRGFLGLGAPRTKFVRRWIDMERCLPEAAGAALSAFVSHDADYLNTHLYDRTFPDD